MRPQDQTNNNIGQGVVGAVGAVSTNSTAPASLPRDSFRQSGQLPRARRLSRTLIIFIAAFIIILIGVLVWLTISRITSSGVTQAALTPDEVLSQFGVSRLSFPPSSLQGVSGVQQLQVNGQLQVGDGLVLTPASVAPAVPQAGEMYYSQITNQLYYFNGKNFVGAVGTQGQAGARGPAGLQGVAGAAGTNGLNGKDGTNGTSSDAILNQTTLQTADFNISGTGMAGVLNGTGSVLTPLIDTSTSTALNIAPNNATGITLGKTSANITTTINGIALVKPTPGHDTANVFQVQNSSAANLLTVDSSNTTIVLGNDSAPANLTVRGGAAAGSNVTGSNLTFDASNGTGGGGSGDFIFRTAPIDTNTAITLDNFQSQSGGTGISSLSWNHTPSSSINSILIVAAVTDTAHSFNAVSGVTYEGTNLTRLSAITCPTADAPFGCHVELWYLIDPSTSGTHQIIETLASGTSVLAGGSATYTNINTSAPFGTPSAVSGSTSGATQITNNVITTSTQQLVIDALTANNAISAPGGTQLWNSSANSAIADTGSSTPASGGT
ncbi:MAG TPA: collagen-like protein, partial [Candidatus Acidoferrum sp.]|nr:collagen-like protein [Candidatus Acidoferrum sp.]